MSLTLLYSLLLSLTLHVALLLFGPSVNPPVVKEDTDTPVDVDLVHREVPLPDALRPVPIPPIKAPKPLDLSRLLDRPLSAAAEPGPSLKADPAFRGTEKSPKSRPLPGPPRLNLPQVEPAPGPLASPAPVPPALDAGVLAVPPEKPGDLPPLRGRADVRTRSDEGKELTQELARLSPSVPQPEVQPPAIRGPASHRRIIFRPAPPQVEALEKSEDILLRFWVLPDGTVGRVLPVRKGSARLEGIATNHLKRWRFSPLPPDVPQREEWGELAFRFRVK